MCVSVSLGLTTEWNVTIVPLCNECESVFHSTQPVYSNSLSTFLYTSISIYTVALDPPNFGTSLYHYKGLVLVLGVYFLYMHVHVHIHIQMYLYLARTGVPQHT